MEKRPALGKGLSALIPDAADALTAPRASLDVDIDLLEPNHYQPRAQFDNASLEDLARSIKSNGVIQPIVVRRVDGGHGLPAVTYDARSRGAEAYFAFAKEVIQRNDLAASVQ